MLWLSDAFEAIRDFMALGGPVLKAIAVTMFLMWVLIVERIMYFRSYDERAVTRRSTTSGKHGLSVSPGTHTRSAN